jgi:hypothetical protein
MTYETDLVEKVAKNLMRVPGQDRFQWKFEADSDSLVGAMLGVSTKTITNIREANGWNLHKKHFDNKGHKRKPRRKAPPTIVFTGEKTVAEKLNPTPKPIIIKKSAPEVEETVTRKQFVDVVDRLNRLEASHKQLRTDLGE